MTTHPHRVNYACAFNYVMVTHRMMYTHVTEEKFNPFRRTGLITWALLIGQIVFSVLWNESLMDEPTLYLIIDVISFCSMFHLMYFVTDELKEILNIYVFVITRKMRSPEEEKLKRDKETEELKESEMRKKEK